MVGIPDYPEQRLADIIWQAREKQNAASGRGIYLSRLGASSLGHPCPRAVFFDWRAYARVPFEGRMLNLFKSGHLMEDRVVDDLRLAGLEVWATDENSKQFTYTDPETGHAVVKLDGVVRGVPGYGRQPHVLEVKTHNDKSFIDLIKRRMQLSKPDHYWQCQMGMWLTGLDAALYIGRNKNDENYHFERSERDPETIEQIEKRIGSLYRATLIPPGVSADATGYICEPRGLFRGCNFREVCLGGEPLKNCRTCRNVEPGPEGSWLCNLHEKVLDWDDQRTACDSWDPLKAEPVGKFSA